MERDAAERQERDLRAVEELAVLRRQLDEAQAACATERKAVEAGRAWLTAERQRADRLQAERQQLVEQRAPLERRAGELEAALREQGEELAAARDEALPAAEARAAAAERELAAARRVMRELSETLDRQARQHQELEVAFDEVSDAYEELLRQLEALRADRGGPG
ncbi:MAG: hypothetical protein M9894_28655 [Planctomycetes bacterium]|nr:hypothetical protein [Planctomycetota bacterium]